LTTSREGQTKEILAAVKGGVNENGRKSLKNPAQ